jgi:hypothetical protein
VNVFDQQDQSALRSLAQRAGIELEYENARGEPVKIADDVLPSLGFQWNLTNVDFRALINRKYRDVISDEVPSYLPWYRASRQSDERSAAQSL